MYENEELMNNEVIEETTTDEVINNEDSYVPAAPAMPEIYVPTTDTETDSHGPNKLLIAAAIGGGLIVGRKLLKKVKPKIEQHKAKKAAAKEEEIMKVLVKAGLVVPAPATNDETVVEVKPEDIKEAAPAEETKTEEKKEEKK